MLRSQVNLQSKYIKFSLLRVTLLAKRYALPSFPLSGYIKLVESQTANIVRAARPKLKKLTITSLSTRTSLIGSDGGPNLQAILLRTHQVRQLSAVSATATSIFVTGLRNISNNIAT
jgi:hypothetical protein